MTSYWWNDLNIRPVWVEITRRPNDDIGKDLNHERASRKAYDLLAEPRPRDKVLHWDSKRGQFVGVSTVARYHFDEGKTRWVPLKGFEGFPLDSLTLELIRSQGRQIGRIRESLSPAGQSTHYPFQPYGAEGWGLLRPALAYLTAAPLELVALLGGIYTSSIPSSGPAPTWEDYGLGTPSRLGQSKNRAGSTARRRYLEANEDLVVTSSGELRLPNHSRLEAGHRQHNALQNKVAAWLRDQGLVPLSQRALDQYPVDIQWEDGRTLCVAEVKSINSGNEISQMRRGIGQVLHYRHLASKQDSTRKVRPALIVPRKPSKEWIDICEDVGIIVAWPGRFQRLRHVHG